MRSSANPAPEETLATRIVESLIYSAFPENSNLWFLPRDKIDELVTYEAVKSELGHQASKDLIDDYIIKSAKKLFLVSILSHMTGSNLREAMERFKEHSFDDKSLPIDVQGPNSYPSCFDCWDVLSKYQFKDAQWKLLAPVFPLKLEERSLRAEHILPFTYVDSQRKGGTFGDIYQVTVHESHQESPMRKNDGSLANAALKELKVSTNSTGKPETDKVFKEWEAEAKALEDMSSLKHDHIVSVKSIFTKGTRHYFMFQWADGGSLRDLYQEDWQSNLTAATVREIVSQLIGLAGALKALHEYRQEKGETPIQSRQPSPGPSLLDVPGQAGQIPTLGSDESYRHGDLKPENILRFTDDSRVGMWKIADMGLAKHHLAATGFRGPTNTLNATTLYEPPEVYTSPEKARSRQYDIWSMGCIMLELLVWMLYGRKALNDFSKSMLGDTAWTGQVAPYWEFERGSNRKTACLRRSVLDCMSRIRNDPECQRKTAVKDLLDIVQNRLLIIPLPPGNENGSAAPGVHAGPGLRVPGASSRSNSSHTSRPLPVPGPFRAKAEELRKALEKVRDNGEKDEAYWLTGEERGGLMEPLAGTSRGPEIQVRIQHHP